MNFLFDCFTGSVFWTQDNTIIITEIHRRKDCRFSSIHDFKWELKNEFHCSICDYDLNLKMNFGECYQLQSISVCIA